MIIDSKIKSAGLRKTRQRRIILEELQGTVSHPTAEELHEMVRKRLPRISLGTVYRNLDLLASAGEILKLDTGTRKRFDANTNNHYHLRCLSCGRVVDVDMVPNNELNRLAEVVTGYQVKSHNLEFRGYCPQCQKNKQMDN